MKTKIRHELKTRRNSLSPTTIAEWSDQITEHLRPLLNPYQTIMVYVSKPPEVETRPLIHHLLSQGKRVVVPIIERETCTLRLSYLPNPNVLITSTFNVPEPIGNEIPASAEEVEVAIIPLIAFDINGNRLGYGAGYYDRFLQAHPTIVKIGVAFSVQQAPSIPGDTKDVRMDSIVTERRIYRCDHLSV